MGGSSTGSVNILVLLIASFSISRRFTHSSDDITSLQACNSLGLVDNDFATLQV